MNHEQLHALLTSHDQASTLRFWSELNSDQQTRFARQLADIDFDQLATLIRGEDQKQDLAAMAAAAVSPPSVRADGSGATWTVEEAVAQGEEALRSGHVAAILVAGGQGTRLGFDQPKGMFPIGPVSKRTLFEFFADRLLATEQQYGVPIPFYVMTSEATDRATREYFEANDHLGLQPDQIRIFKQGTMPAVDSATGDLLLAEKGSLALSPDGHGGTVSALKRSGSLDDATERGIKHLAYIQVDNPLANLCDPALIGHHIMAQSELTTQVVRKRYPKERVGNVVLVDGHVQIIEYSDLPDEAAEATDEKGELKLWAGSIGVHVISIDFLHRMSQSTDALPFHRASKKVPYLNEAGDLVTPTEPNATKFERFIFDLLPQAENAFVVESLPSEAFAPVKNAEGAETDTASLARQAISDLHQDWLQSAGVTIAPDVLVEINPRFAATKSQLTEKVSANLQIGADTYLDQ